MPPSSCLILTPYPRTFSGRATPGTLWRQGLSTRRIGDFELHELLGEGAMGKVYRAQDVNLDRPVAIKLLGERTFGDPSFTDRFKRDLHRLGYHIE